MKVGGRVALGARLAIWSTLGFAIAWALGNGLDGGEVSIWPLMLGVLAGAVLLADIALVATRSSLSNPPWWYRDVFLGVIVGCLLLVGQTAIDDQSAKREFDRDQDRAIENLVANNLDFVRTQATDGSRLLPFSGINLKHTNMNGLPLNGADFSFADLNFASLRGASLQGARFNGADLVFTDFSDADLRKASFLDTTLGSADLRGANLAHAILPGAEPLSMCYDIATIWPADFVPGEIDCNVSEFELEPR